MKPTIGFTLEHATHVVVFGKTSKRACGIRLPHFSQMTFILVCPFKTKLDGLALNTLFPV
jgi:hypothetical protein